MGSDLQVQQRRAQSGSDSESAASALRVLASTALLLAACVASRSRVRVCRVCMCVCAGRVDPAEAQRSDECRVRAQSSSSSSTQRSIHTQHTAHAWTTQRRRNPSPRILTALCVPRDLRARRTEIASRKPQRRDTNAHDTAHTQHTIVRDSRRSHSTDDSDQPAAFNRSIAHACPSLAAGFAANPSKSD